MRNLYRDELFAPETPPFRILIIEGDKREFFCIRDFILLFESFTKKKQFGNDKRNNFSMLEILVSEEYWRLKMNGIKNKFSLLKVYILCRSLTIAENTK